MFPIIGYINYQNSTKKTINSMKKISYRGKDSAGIFDGKNIHIAKTIPQLHSLFPTPYSLLPKPSSLFPTPQSPISIGHLLHSIVDFMPQPIKKKGILVTNCEIYNWEELAQKYNIKAKSDSELLCELLDKFGINILDELDGPYAFAYFKDNQLILARDILGIKPLFYICEKNKLAFASEKKALPKNAQELEPTNIFIYDLTRNKYVIEVRKFYELKEEHTKSYTQIKKDTEELLINAIKKRIPKGQKIGILFSGGVDSTAICYILKKLKIDFTCYTAKLNGGNIEEAQDLIYAKEIASKYNFKLKITEIETSNLEPIIKKVIELIEDRDYIKVSVALPFYIACEQAKKDGVKVMFSGLGSEEIFAGYRRHKKAENANLECIKGLEILHTRDLYRDDCITMANNTELRLPFLDKNLINYSLNIPVKYKISKDKTRSKIVLRDLIKEMGLDEKYAERQKQAAQYGSKFDKGILRLSKNKKMTKQDYLNSLEIKGVEQCEFKGNLG